jgi:dTDP-4-amino-4,6-dideoxygalactose transaminase
VHDRALRVTRSSLPPLEEYAAYLDEVWRRGHLTNHGPLATELEEQLSEQLAVPHVLLMANGTLALQISVRALDLHGEIITTPYSYVATTSAIVWEHAEPRFVDIEPRTFTIDTDQIEASITERTTAILSTHVYGFPCDVDRIADIAARHGLKVVYDAAHAFGVWYRGRPLPSYGDVSTLSFHATKIFHTVEGGAVATEDGELAERVAYMRNHGHDGEEAFSGLGINAKCSELHAAMGLCLLPRVAEIVAERRERVELYQALLAPSGIVTWEVPEGLSWNYGYFPVVFTSEQVLLKVREALQRQGVFPRRYFYPPLTSLPYVDCAPAPIAASISERVLCLPLHERLPLDEVRRVAAILTHALEAG